MKKLNVVLCSWRSPEILRVCIDSLLGSFTVEASIKVVLNEGDKKSIEILGDMGIEFVKLNENLGTLAVDFVRDLLDGEYWVNSNDDMIYHKGWDSDLIQLCEEYYPASASCGLVEPYSGNPNIVLTDNLGPFETAKNQFLINHRNGKYKFDCRRVAYNHPILIRTNDFYSVRGYSDNFNLDFWPGYSLDHYFPWRLWKKHNENFRFIRSEKNFVYHGVSMTNEKLDSFSKRLDGRAAFIKHTGMSVESFDQRINLFSQI